MGHDKPTPKCWDEFVSAFGTGECVFWFHIIYLLIINTFYLPFWVAQDGINTPTIRLTI